MLFIIVNGKLFPMKGFFSKEIKLLFLVVALALSLRLFLAFNFEATGDMSGWIRGGKTGLENKDYGYGKIIYNKNCIGCPNWPPLSYHSLILARWSYLNLNPFNLPQWGFYKFISVLADTGIILVLYSLAKHLKLKNPLMIASVYAFHPIALEIASYHGQKDSIWLFFGLLTVFFLQKKQTIFAALMMGLGISFKLPLIFLFPLFFFSLPKLKEKITFTIIFLLASFLLNLPEIYYYFNEVIKQNFFYKGWFGWWGLSGIISKIGLLMNNPSLLKTFDPFNRAIFYLSVFFSSIYFVKKKIPLVNACLGVLMIIYVFIPSFASQYLIWPLPFLILLKDSYPRYFKFYTIYGTFFAMNFYGVFGISFLEKIFLTIPRENIYYKIPGLIYPMDLGFPLWIFSIYFLKKIINEKTSKK